MIVKFQKIYVFCPNDFVTGGPDALHQIVYYLNGAGMNAKIVYFAFSRKHQYSIPKTYKNYVSEFFVESDIVDNPDCAVIIPESAIDKQARFKKATVFIWWLSVDNNQNRSSLLWKSFFFATLPARIIKNFWYYRKRWAEAVVKTLTKRSYSFKSEKENVEHLCASYYALDYVTQRTQKKTTLCIEPISKFFLNRYEELQGQIDLTKRSDKILYNPRKSGYFVKKLAEFAPDLSFEPLVGLTQDQLIEKYMSAKLYVDFGPFPGAERIPKEAVLFGCCVITGRNGASGFYGDVPISDEYKFANPLYQIDEISTKIRQVLESYETRKSDFVVYRKTVLNLENNFIETLKECMR